MKLTIVIPARNEEESLPMTLSGLAKGVKSPYEVIVVNDHSTDRTEDVVNEFAEEHKNVRVIVNDTDPGITNTIKKGFSQVTEGAVVVVMADFCDQPETIDKMYQKICDGYDVVCGSRYMKGGKKIGGRFMQTLFSKFVGYSLHYSINLPTADASNAFKMYRINALNNIEIEEAGFASSLEIVVKLYKKGYKISETPTVWKDRVAGQSNFKIFKVANNYIKWYSLALFSRRRRLKDDGR